jgi:2-keto-4-pentenoate hydratase/2-oxohepta-3-ene-1,7-dioic acid hydratase in catechol pathway
MRVVTYTADDDPEAQPVGLVEGDSILDFARAFMIYCTVHESEYDLSDCYHAGSALDMLRAGLFTVETFGEIREFIRRHRLIGEVTAENPRLLAPIPRPPRIIALGLNYAAHAEETGKEPPEEPIFFAKAATAVIGPEEPVICPDGVGRIDHEVELAVIVGGGGRRISREHALEHVAGYTILNDVTARDWQRRDMEASRPWFMSKSLDTFAPMGPWIVLPDEMSDPSNLTLTLRVNGEVRQQSSTRDLIFDVPELIHRVSRHIALEPGDVISTGTPSGISPLQPGDVMEAEIEGIGVLRNPVVAGV